MHLRPTPRLAILAALLGGTALPLQAETLQEALVAAYRDNPTLTATRAGQRATDESYNLQKANGLPDVGLQGQFNERIQRHPDPDPITDFQARRSVSATLSISAPIYSGGRVRNGMKAAATRIEAGQSDVRATELSIFSQVVAAYMDVIRGESVVQLSGNNVQVLDVNLRATNNRFQVGDLTRTDVAQSESRLALARGDLKTAEASLIEARERYTKLVGHAPVDLQAPPALPGLPGSTDDAVDIALANNPDLATAKKVREATRYEVRVAQGLRLPTLSAYSNGSYTNNLKSAPVINQGFVQFGESVTVGATLSLPLYQGGGPGAQVRQNQAREQQAMEQETAVERDVIAQTRSLYSSWQASNEVIVSSRTAVDASALSLQGVRAENSVGTRTILDILNAEQESFIARVQLVTAERNAYVAAFSLLAAMGRISPADFGITDAYDPKANYERVKGKWFDWDDDDRAKPISSRTVDSPAQSATVKAEVTN